MGMLCQPLGIYGNPGVSSRRYQFFNPSYTMVIVIKGDESLSHERMLMCQQGVEQKNELN